MATVDRYVKKRFGIGGEYGEYYLDHTADGGYINILEPHVAYAEADSPDGQTFFVFRLPWVMQFKWIARCVKGPHEGKTLSILEKKFITSGHWLWRSKHGGQIL